MGKKHPERVSISFDLIASDWLKKMARNWTLAALDEISYNTHSSRLTFSTFLQIVWTLFRYVQVLEWAA